MAEKKLNELPPDARFRIDSIPVDEHIAALVVTDLMATLEAVYDRRSRHADAQTD